MKNQIHAYLLQNNISIAASPFSNGFVEELRKIENPRVQRPEARGEPERGDTGGLDHDTREGNEQRGCRPPDETTWHLVLLGAADRRRDRRDRKVRRLVEPRGVFGVGAIDPLVRREDVPRTNNEVREQEPEVGDGPVREGPHESRARWDGRRVDARIRRKKGDQKAIVAVSAKLLKIVYWVLKEKRAYHS